MHLVTNADELSIDVLQTGLDGVSDGLLDLLLDQTSSQWVESLVEKVVLGVTNVELEGVDLDLDIIDLEDGGVVLAGRDKSSGSLDKTSSTHCLSMMTTADTYGQATSTKKDIGDTTVAQLGDTTLLLEVEHDITHVSLDLTKCQGKAMTILVLDGVVGRELDEVVGLD